jgi:hypothetical protein
VRDPLRSSLALALPCALAGLVALAPGGLRADDAIRLAYSPSAPHAEVASDWSLSITIAGSDQLTGFVRSMHPLLSLNNVHIRSRGRAWADAGNHKIENDEARTEGIYDDDSFLFDFKRTEPPADLATNKLEQLMMAFSAGRSYSLSASGEYRSDDPNQDQNGEAMDHYILGVTRLPAKAVQEGDTYSLDWKGERSEKNKHGHYRFHQSTKVEKVEGSLVTLASSLKAELEVPEAEKDHSAEEAWQRCEGTTRVLLDAATGRIVRSSGKGKVTVYYRAAAEDGGKNDVTLTFAVEGHHEGEAPRERKGHWF